MDVQTFLAEDRSLSLIITASVMMSLSTFFVALRAYARYLASTSFNVQDVIIPFAWMAEMGLCVNGIIMCKIAKTGRHMAFIVTLDPAKIPEHFKGLMILELLHPAAVALPKLLVVLLYLHILTNKYERIAAKALLAVIFATWFSYTMAAMFQCTPFAFNWDKMIPNGRCFNLQAFANSSSAPNIFTDLAVLVLPLRTVWGLKISTGRRVGLLLIFLTGSVGIVASVIRTVVFAKTLAAAGPLDDSTYNHVALVNWTIIEPGIYLLSACALSFKPLFRMLAQALHLQAFLTHTKTTFQTGKSQPTKLASAGAQSDVQLQSLSGMGSGKFYRLSEDSQESEGSKKMEVLVTRTIDVEQYKRESIGVRDYAKGVGMAV